MSVAHDPWIVALSVLVAIQGAYVALGLTPRINQRVGLARRLSLAGAACTFAVSIWSMHFVGMLAMRPPMRLDYLLLPTVLSLLLCSVVVGVAIYVGSLAPVRRWALPLAAGIMGVGIAGMHYVGMAALRGSVVMHQDWRFVLGSFVVAIAAAVPGLRLAFLPRTTARPVLAAIVLGIAISGMHYVGMAGLTLQAMPVAGVTGQSALSLSPDVLAVVVAVAAFTVSAVCLLTLVPDHAPLVVPPPGVAPAVAPAGGEPAGGELRVPVAQTTSIQPLEPETSPPEPLPKTLPIEREGVTQQLPVQSIVYVQADTHYTTIFDGGSRLFCPLPIGDVEQRLDAARFLRVHRSYLVAVDRIARLHRAGDGGLAELDTLPPARVPVSRNRYPALKQRLMQPVVGQES